MNDEEVKEKLSKAIELSQGLTESPNIELVGIWLWLTFARKPKDETRQALKAGGFKWHSKKHKWYLNPTGIVRKGKNQPWNRIVHKYGVTRVREEEKAAA